MPTIFKHKKNYNPKKQQNDLEKKKRSEIYNSSRWRKMRLAKQMENPICEICKMLNKVSLTEDIHHLVSFTNLTGNERDAVAFDYNNLIALCKQHHNDIHHGWLKGAKSKEEIKQYIEAHKETDDNK